MTPSKEIALWLCSGCCALVLEGFSARDLQIAAAGWPITSVPTKISGVADFSTFCGLICPPVATPPQSQRFGEEWTKRNQEKWISSKPSVGKLTKSASDCFRSRSMAFMNPSRKRTKSPLLSRKYEWKYMFWCPHEKCDGILWREKAGRLSSDRLLSVEAAAAFYSQMTSLISNSPRFHFKDDTELGLKTLLIGPQWPHTHMLGMGLVYCIYCAWLKM